jgi:GDP-L-galactose phosphorylase
MMCLQVRGVHIERLQGYPVHGWVFSGADNVDSLASCTGAICMQLQALDVPHNLLICDRGSRVILWPQCFAEKQAKGLVPYEVLATGVNPAAFEIAGHMVLKRAEDYDSISEEGVWELLSHVGLDNERMAAVQSKVFATYMSSVN